LLLKETEKIKKLESEQLESEYCCHKKKISKQGKNLKSWKENFLSWKNGVRLYYEIEREGESSH